MSFAITSEFNGSVIDQIFLLLVTQNQTVDGGHVHIENNIFKQRSIPRATSDNLIQDRAATPTSQGSIVYDERVLAPEDIMVYVEFNPNDFRDVWEPFQPQGDFVFSRLSPEVQRAVVELALEGVGGVDPYMGSAIWQGDIAGGAPPFDKFDGFLKKAADDADVIDEVLAGPVDDGNIVANIELVYNAAPVAVRTRESFKIFLSEGNKEHYWNALMSKASSDANPFHDVAQSGPLTYKGKRVVSLVGLTDDNIVATHSSPGRDSNLYLGLAGPGANNEEVVKIERLQANSELWFIKVLWGADTQIKWGQELVLGSTP